MASAPGRQAAARRTAGILSPESCFSGREGAGCGGCWGAPRCLSAGIRGGQRQQGHPRSRCSWLVAPRALRPRPRRRLPPSPLRGLRAGTQLTPWPRSLPPLRLPGADGAASSAAPRAAGPAAASAAQRPAPGSPPPPASPPRDTSPAVTQAACPGTSSPAESTRRRDQPARAAARRWGLSSGREKKSSHCFPAGPLRPLIRPPGGSAVGDRLGLVPSLPSLTMRGKPEASLRAAFDPLPQPSRG